MLKTLADNCLLIGRANTVSMEIPVSRQKNQGALIARKLNSSKSIWTKSKTKIFTKIRKQLIKSKRKKKKSII